LALLFSVLTCAAPLAGHAQDAVDAPLRDQRVHARVEQILARSEFVELAETDRGSLGRMLAAWLRQLKDFMEADRHADAELSKFALPSPSPWLVLSVGIALLALFAAYVVWRRGRDPLTVAEVAAAQWSRIDSRVAPERLLEDADLLAERGDFAAALRSLYVATIVSLHRRRLIALEPSTTNWQYQRQLPRGDLRGAFADFTRVFDHKHYGEEMTTSDEYAACRGLADRLCADEVVATPRSAERRT
jgi:hypothetical protein